MLTFLLLACARPSKPPMVAATNAGLAACSTADVTSWRHELAQGGMSRIALEASTREYELSVARWGLCMVLKDQENWRIPRVVDPDAQALLQAAGTHARSQERIVALEALSEKVQDARALLALQTLEAVFFTEDWHATLAQLGLSEEAGLQQLRQWAVVPEDTSSMTVAFRGWVRDRWTRISRVEVPVAVLPNQLQVPIGLGDPLQPSSGTFLVYREGNVRAQPMLVESFGPEGWSMGPSRDPQGLPLLAATGDPPVGALIGDSRQRTRLLVQDAKGELMVSRFVLPSALQARDSPPPAGALVFSDSTPVSVVLQQVGEIQDPLLWVVAGQP